MADAAQETDASERTDGESAEEKRQRKRRARSRDITEKVTIGILVGAVGGAVAGIILAILTPWVVDQIEGPTCDDTEDLVAVSPISVGATTWLTEEEESGNVIVHEPRRAVDHDSGTSWVEDAEDPANPYGRGEQVRFEFDEPADLQLICVVNGYAKSWDLYEANARARQWTVDTEQGQHVAVLADKTPNTYAGFQKLEFEAGTTGHVTLIIETTRAGLGDDGFRDTALSEVEFWANGSTTAAATPTTTPPTMMPIEPSGGG